MPSAVQKFLELSLSLALRLDNTHSCVALRVGMLDNHEVAPQETSGGIERAAAASYSGVIEENMSRKVKAFLIENGDGAAAGSASLDESTTNSTASETGSDSAEPNTPVRSLSPPLSDSESDPNNTLLRLPVPSRAARNMPPPLISTESVPLPDMFSIATPGAGSPSSVKGSESDCGHGFENFEKRENACSRTEESRSPKCATRFSLDSPSANPEEEIDIRNFELFSTTPGQHEDLLLKLKALQSKNDALEFEIEEANEVNKRLKSRNCAGCLIC